MAKEVERVLDKMSYGQTQTNPSASEKTNKAKSRRTLDAVQLLLDVFWVHLRIVNMAHLDWRLSDVVTVLLPGLDLVRRCAMKDILEVLEVLSSCVLPKLLEVFAHGVHHEVVVFLVDVLRRAQLVSTGGDLRLVSARLGRKQSKMQLEQVSTQRRSELGGHVALSVHLGLDGVAVIDDPGTGSADVSQSQMENRSLQSDL